MLPVFSIIHQNNSGQDSSYYLLTSRKFRHLPAKPLANTIATERTVVTVYSTIGYRFSGILACFSGASKLRGFKIIVASGGMLIAKEVFWP